MERVNFIRFNQVTIRRVNPLAWRYHYWRRHGQQRSRCFKMPKILRFKLNRKGSKNMSQRRIFIRNLKPSGNQREYESQSRARQSSTRVKKKNVNYKHTFLAKKPIIKPYLLLYELHGSWHCMRKLTPPG